MRTGQVRSQFPAPTEPPAKEAFAKSVEVEVEEIRTSIFTAEQLAAIALQTGRPKNKVHRDNLWSRMRCLRGDSRTFLNGTHSLAVGGNLSHNFLSQDLLKPHRLSRVNGPIGHNWRRVQSLKSCACWGARRRCLSPDAARRRCLSPVPHLRQPARDANRYPYSLPPDICGMMKKEFREKNRCRNRWRNRCVCRDRPFGAPGARHTHCRGRACDPGDRVFMGQGRHEERQGDALQSQTEVGPQGVAQKTRKEAPDHGPEMRAAS